MQPAVSVTPHAGLAASALRLESGVTSVPGLDSQLNTTADSITDMNSHSSPGTKPSNTLGMPERPALCYESCGSRARWHTDAFTPAASFHRPVLALHRGRSVSSLLGESKACASAVPFYRGCSAQGRSWCCSSLLGLLLQHAAQEVGPEANAH